ncbi:RNase H-like protein [Colletotrichum truncatum]|uniref:RNase H-like protein n=1 Tax=Colletotrichum truncatum TaxID=5467 RepID=A0ACC3YND0_COLTU
MTTGFDSGISLSSTLNRILRTLNLPGIPVVIYTDSRSLYECLVRLGTTDEKRLMIDIMSLRESYEKKEISEVRWIDGKDNPADAFTKKSPNSALEQLITTSKLRIRIEAYVDRLRGKDE